MKWRDLVNEWVIVLCDVDIVPSITLQEQDIKKVMICFDPVPVLVIHLNGSGAEALRSRCRINDNRDPGFNINTATGMFACCLVVACLRMVVKLH